MAVLVLEPLAVQRRAPGGPADQEPARTAVAGSPGEVADALEAEHRVEDVERHHRDAVVRVRRGRRDPRREGARLVDALLQDLAVLVLAVEHEVLGVLRAGRAGRPGRRSRAGGTCPPSRTCATRPGTIGTIRSPIASSRTSVLRIRTNAIVVEFSRSPLPSSTFSNGGGVGSGSAFACRAGRLPPSAPRRSRR